MAEPPLGSYLVLGASGLAGYHALKKLANKPGIFVTAIHHSRPIGVLAPNIKTLQVDLRKPYSLDEVMVNTDYLLHFAGIVATAPLLDLDPIRPLNDTLAITVNVLASAQRARVEKMVWLSSTTGYPELDRELIEDDMFTGNPPSSWYAIGWMNRYLETLCRAYVEHLGYKFNCHSMCITVLRPSLMYGENDNFSLEVGHFLPALIRRVVERHNPIEIWGDGKQTRDLIYAGDVVNAAFLALGRQTGFDCFNISNGTNVTVNQVAQLIIEIDSFSDARIEHRLDRPGSRTEIRISNEKAQEKLKFLPSISLMEGCQATVQWYRRKGTI